MIRGGVVVSVKHHEAKAKLDNSWYGDRTRLDQLKPCVLKLRKYTHTYTHTTYMFTLGYHNSDKQSSYMHVLVWVNKQKRQVNW